MDRNLELKYFKAESNDECAILEAIKFLRSLEDYRDWDEYDGMQKVFDNLGVSEETFHTILAGELESLGIKMF